MRALRTNRYTPVLLLTLMMLVSTGSYGQDQRNFWALNNTGKTISRLYVSPHEDKSWGSDVLGESQLPTGVGTVISFRAGARTSCLMDFRLVFSDGSEATYPQGRNVCLLGAVQFNRTTSIGMALPSS